jgi:phage tail-like protein
MLPEVYRRYDENIQTFAAALDEVLAPVWMVLDCYDAYMDPFLTPSDFLDMLSAWVAFPIDGNWSDDQARRLVATAVDLYRWRGTRRGLADLVRAYTGVEPEVTDSGGTAWSEEPDAPVPGSPDPAVRVAVAIPADVPSDLERLTRLIAANVPAHVAVTVEVRRGDAPAQLLEASRLTQAISAGSAILAGGSAELSPYGAAVVEAIPDDGSGPYGPADPGSAEPRVEEEP